MFLLRLTKEITEASGYDGEGRRWHFSNVFLSTIVFEWRNVIGSIKILILWNKNELIKFNTKIFFNFRINSDKKRLGMGISEPFSVDVLDNKLKNELNKTQESVQSISRWLIKNHEHGDVIVKSWVNFLLINWTFHFSAPYFTDDRQQLKEKVSGLLGEWPASKRTKTKGTLSRIFPSAFARRFCFFWNLWPGSLAFSKTEIFNKSTLATFEIVDECSCCLGESNCFHWRICKRSARSALCGTAAPVRELYWGNFWALFWLAS